MKFENYYLDLNKVSKLESKFEKELIHSYYRDMLTWFSEGREQMARSILMTLVKGGYLIDSRDDKINKILDDKD